MASKNAKTTTATERKVRVKGNVKKFHDGLIKTSEDVLNGTIKTGERWQDLIAQTVKKSEPIAERNIDILFDTIESIKNGVESSATRVRDLMGLQENPFADVREKIINNDLYKRFRGEVNENVDEVSDAPIVKKVKKVATKAKVEVEDVIEDIKEDVYEAAKIVKEKVSDIKSTGPKTDLTVINGIGPKLQEVLNDAGINNYADLAKSSKADLQKVLDKAGSRYRMHNPEDWKAQAQLAVENKFDELKTWKKS